MPLQGPSTEQRHVEDTSAGSSDSTGRCAWPLVSHRLPPRWRRWKRVWTCALVPALARPLASGSPHPVPCAQPLRTPWCLPPVVRLFALIFSRRITRARGFNAATGTVVRIAQTPAESPPHSGHSLGIWPVHSYAASRYGGWSDVVIRPPQASFDMTDQPANEEINTVRPPVIRSIPIVVSDDFETKNGGEPWPESDTASNRSSPN